jgi:hypothetical protein
MEVQKLMRALVSVAFVLLFVLAMISGAVAGNTYKVLHDFKARRDGGVPKGSLTLDRKGNLYGAAGGGGGAGCSGNGCGVVFELKQTGGRWQEKILHEFADGNDGAFPNGSLVFDTAGNLFGAMSGNSGAGVSGVFELRPGLHGWSNTVIYSPGGCCLVLGKSGGLYGSIGQGKYGAGAVSELVQGSKGWTLNTLYSFCGRSNCPDGVEPRDPLAWDAAGNLYGTTLYGGNSSQNCPGSLGCGVAFQMTRNANGTWKYHVLHRFATFPNDGQYPDGGLVVDAAGNAYGVAAYGGVHGNGTVFKLSRSSNGRWKQTVLYDFPSCDEGCLPGFTMVSDTAGNLYGVGAGGLADCQGYTCGVVFKLTPAAKGKWKYSVVHKFTGTDGGFPNGVIIDAKGKLYGTTQAFGKYGYGVAFEIAP